jgi:HEAT repeat protein
MEQSDDGAPRASLATLIEDFQRHWATSAHMNARDALIAVGDPAVPALMAAYPTMRPDTRRTCVYVLYAIGTPQATAALVQLLEDLDARIRVSAAGWLVYLNDPAAIDAAVPILLAQLNTDTIRHLGRAGDIRAVEPLIAALEALPLDTRTYARRMSLASALGRLGDPRAIPVLERLVQTDTVELDAWGVGIAVSVGEAAQTALHEIAARTTGQRPTLHSAEPPADGGA